MPSDGCKIKDPTDLIDVLPDLITELRTIEKAMLEYYCLRLGGKETPTQILGVSLMLGRILEDFDSIVNQLMVINQ